MRYLDTTVSLYPNLPDDFVRLEARRIDLRTNKPESGRPHPMSGVWKAFPATYDDLFQFMMGLNDEYFEEYEIDGKREWVLFEHSFD